MASIRTRTTTAGVTTHAVLFRHNGKQTSETFTAKKAAERFRALVDALGADEALEMLNGTPEPDPFNLSQLAAQWLAWKEPRVTERTANDYSRDLRKWILPTFGYRDVESITEAEVQRWVDAMSAAPLSPKSVADKHMLLHSMFKWGKAKSRGLVSHNPCEETELPPRTRRPPKGTTVPEFAAILRAAERRNPDAADLILYLGETGWRFSEATALDVRSVTDDGIDVWVDVSQVFRIDGHGRQVIAPDAAKAYASFRRIRLFPASAAMVRRRLVGKGPGDLVFTNSRGRHWNQHTFLRETWPRIIDDAQLGDRRPTPHWLRHMHVAVLSAAGVPPQEIQRRIGHRSITTTLGTYGGMIGDMNDTALANAAELMAGRRNAPGVAPVVRGEVVVAPEIGGPASIPLAGPPPSP